MNHSQEFIDDLTDKVGSAAMEVYTSLGPGLFEETYKECLQLELSSRKIQYRTDVDVPLIFKGEEIPFDLRCDILVEEAICVEIRAAEELLPLHTRQLTTCVKLLNLPKGVLYNFIVVDLMNEGQMEYVNN